jgi:hypothetical protein
MAGCLGMVTVSFGGCLQTTTSRRNRQVSQTFPKAEVAALELEVGDVLDDENK